MHILCYYHIRAVLLTGINCRGYEIFNIFIFLIQRVQVKGGAAALQNARLYASQAAEVGIITGKDHNVCEEWPIIYKKCPV